MSETAPARQDPWLFGPFRDVVFGCGAGYAIVLVAVSASGLSMETVWKWIGFGMLLVSIPHYGATILRVYENRHSLHKYAFFSVYATLTLFALMGVAAHSALLGSWLLTIYLSWSPWHYAGQNYGLTMMFLRRRGVPVSRLLRRALHLSFVLSFVVALIPIHSGTLPPNSLDPLASEVVRFLPLGIPSGLGLIVFAIAGAAYAGSAILAVVLMLRAADRPARLAPSLCLVATQAVWFSIPAVLSFRFPDAAGAIGKTVLAFSWIAMGHGVQYLWVTSYYASKSERAEKPAWFLLKALTAGGAVWMFPYLIFAPAALGRMPFDVGLSLLGAAVINIHHFILDGAIWKLRDGPIARILIRSQSDADPVGVARRSRSTRPILVRLVWGVAASGFVLHVMGLVLEARPKEALLSGDRSVLEATVEELEWIGRDTSALHISVAELAAKEGDVEAAMRELETALALFPTPAAWVEIGKIRERQGLWGEAIEAYDSALTLKPNDPLILGRRVVALKRRGALSDRDPDQDPDRDRG